MRRQLIVFLWVSLILASMLLLDESVSKAQAIDRVNSSLLARNEHEPIVITNNSDFLEQKNANNWTGSGEPHDPITIADYRIEFSHEGITIKNVDLHWAIVNCETADYDIQYTFSTGIRIVNCTNGVIEYSLAHMKETGIFIDESDHISLQYNTVHDCATGVSVSRSQFVVLDTNNFGWNDWVGVNMTLTDMCTVTHNSIISVPDYGIQCLYDNSTYISENEITSTYLEDEYNEFANIGVFSYGSWNLAMFNNHVHECARGLELWLVNGSWIWESEIGNCTEFCIYLGGGTFNVTVVSNYIGPTYGTNAYDEGEDNHWDEHIDEIGNHWSDYSGSGYYYISGPAESIDHFPNGFTPGNNNVTNTHTTPTTTSNTTESEGDGTHPAIIAISLGSSIIIVMVAILIFRSRKAL